jgi:hypothetical protein
MPRPLYCRGELSLMQSTVAGDSPRGYFPALVDKSSQQSVIMVIDNVHLVFAETTYPPPSAVKFGSIILSHL